MSSFSSIFDVHVIKLLHSGTLCSKTGVLKENNSHQRHEAVWLKSIEPVIPFCKYYMWRWHEVFSQMKSKVSQDNLQMLVEAVFLFLLLSISSIFGQGFIYMSLQRSLSCQVRKQDTLWLDIKGQHRLWTLTLDSRHPPTPTPSLLLLPDSESPAECVN